LTPGGYNFNDFAENQSKQYHLGLHIRPPGLHKISWTVQLEYALLSGEW